MQAGRARAGDPLLGRDGRRRAFLLELRISAEAITAYLPISPYISLYLLLELHISAEAITRTLTLTVTVTLT